MNTVLGRWRKKKCAQPTRLSICTEYIQTLRQITSIHGSKRKDVHRVRETITCGNDYGCKKSPVTHQPEVGACETMSKTVALSVRFLDDDVQGLQQHAKRIHDVLFEFDMLQLHATEPEQDIHV